MNHEKHYDLIVIGGGASGMMSAVIAGKNGEKVLLLEKNSILGKKLRITGGGRCNITNYTLENRKLLPKYGNAEPFLYSIFSKYSVKDTLSFFNEADLSTKVEEENRVFPESDKAEDVAETLIYLMKKYGVTVMTEVKIKKLLATGDRITGVRTTSGILTANRYILATGGTSRPETGSTGDGYVWLDELGYHIIKPKPSLVPIEVTENWVGRLSGISLTEANISLIQNGTLFNKSKGKVLFTHNGLSGPGILNLSQKIGEALREDPVEIRINLASNKTEEEVLNDLKNLTTSSPNKQIQNALCEILTTKFVLIILELCQIEPTRLMNSITRNERHRLLTKIRALSFKVKRLLGPDKAVIASGGLDLAEINFKTMQAKRHTNLYIVGDLLNINRPSGGYSLQLCWTMGYVAGMGKRS